MHIHGNSMSIQAANLYSAGQGEKTAASQQAAEVRRKLQKAAAAPEAGSTPEETLLIGQWMDARHSQVLSGDEYRATATGKDPEFG